MSLNKISAISPGLAKEYSASATYDVGEYVLYGNAYWKCKTTIAIGEDWNPEHWELDDSPLDTVNGDLNGKAPLVDGKVPAEYLPSYVDDVIEGYYYDSKFYTTIEHTEEITPERGKIYVDITSTSETRIYRWSGSAYIDITSHTDISTKVDKVPTATEDNFAAFNSEGGIKDSGVAKDDFLYTREYDRTVTVIVREPHSWEESEPAADRVSNQFYMHFTPSGFGATEDCYLTSFSVMTSDRGVPVPGTVDKLIYAKVLNSSGGTALMVSEPVSGENMSTSTFYTFTFNSDTKLDRDQEYRLVFSVGAQEGASALVFPVSTSANMGTQQLIYPNGTPTYRLIAKATYEIEVEEERTEHVVEKYKLQQIAQEGTHSENPLVNKEYADQIAQVADTAIQGVQKNGTDLTPDANNVVNVTVPVASTDVPPMAEGTGSAGTSDNFAKGDHVHPAETKVVAYRLPDDCFPITYTDSELPEGQQSCTIEGNDGIRFEFVSQHNFVVLHDIASEAAGGSGSWFSTFSASTLKWASSGVAISNLKFHNTQPTANTWPILEKDVVFVREVRVVKPRDIPVTSVNSRTGAVQLDASAVGALPTVGGGVVHGSVAVAAGLVVGSSDMPSGGMDVGEVKLSKITSTHNGCVLLALNGSVNVLKVSASHYEGIPLASSNSSGAVKLGGNIIADSSGVISVPIASSNRAGVVLIGANINISSSDGSISVATGSTNEAGVVLLNSTPINCNCSFANSSGAHQEAVTPYGLSLGLRYMIPYRGSSGGYDTHDRQISHLNSNEVEYAEQASISLPTQNNHYAARDFIVDVDYRTDDPSATAHTLRLGSNYGTAWHVCVAEGEDLTDILTFSPGDVARLYFTETSFYAASGDNTPVFLVARQNVDMVEVNNG